MVIEKHGDFFNPDSVKDDIHIIGVGAVGSSIAELLTRLGINKLHIYDFDIVEGKNVANQMFWDKHIGIEKTEAVEEICKTINPDIVIEKHGKWVEGTPLNGYVFMCVDNIDLRRSIVMDCIGKDYIEVIFDGRMDLTDAQCFAARCDNEQDINKLLQTMNFSQDEVKQTMSACNTALSVCYTVRLLASYMVSNFVNYTLNGSLYTSCMINTKPFQLVSF